MAYTITETKNMHSSKYLVSICTFNLSLFQVWQHSSSFPLWINNLESAVSCHTFNVRSISDLNNIRTRAQLCRCKAFVQVCKKSQPEFFTRN